MPKPNILKMALLVMACLGADFAAGQQSVELNRAIDAINRDRHLQFFPVQGNVFALVNPDGGSNLTVQVGEEGVMVIDAGGIELAEEARDMIQSLTAQPIRYLIHTSARSDFAGGNAVIAAAGAGYTGVANNDQAMATIFSHENTMLRLAGVGERAPAEHAVRPGLSFIGARQDFFFNDETVQVIRVPAAHSDSDSIVFFRKSDVVSAGPVYLTTSYPEIDLQRGGSIDGLISALNRIIDLTNTRRNQEGGTLVIAGKGGVTDEAGVVEYRDMLAVIRGRIAYYMEQGMSLEQVQAQRPTIDYDGMFAGSGLASPEQFTEIVFRSLERSINGGVR